MIRFSINFILLLSFISLINCGSEPEEAKPIPASTRDRFADQFEDISEIAELKQLTNSEQDYIPFFNTAGNRIFYSSLFTIKEDENDSSENEIVEIYYSMDYKTGKLFILQDEPIKPQSEYLQADLLPDTPTEKPLYGIRSGNALYYTAAAIANKNINVIYQMIDDSLTQLTFGKQSSLLQTISPDGRFVSFLYDRSSSFLVIYDNQSGEYYVVPKNDSKPDQLDYAAGFSPDSKYLVFLRSGNLYTKNNISYGNIWLIEFKD